MLTQESALLPWIILLPILGAAINGIFGSKLSKRTVTVIAVSAPVAAFVLAVFAFFQLLAMPVAEGSERALVSELWMWAKSDSLTVGLDFMLDHLSAIMVLVVTGVGSLIHVFSIGYMWEDKAYWRYFSYLNLFMAAMLTLVLGKNLLILFFGWEGVGVCSYLLIGFWYGDMAKSEAGQKAFVTNRVGDFAFLIGMFVLLFYSQGTIDFQHLPGLFTDGGVLNPWETGVSDAILNQRYMTVTFIAVMFFVAACGKSAQIPLHVWLPDAMAGPTPVSALIHAATMVTAGVYLMVRMSYMYGVTDIAMTVVATVGAITALFAASVALVQNDIKKVLAYSTVSQLGFMVLAVGSGAYVAAIFHLMTHAFFKACLFLGSGSVIHAMHHEQDIRQMGGLRKKMPVTALTFFVSCLAISGIPLFAGFFSKDEILFRTFSNDILGGGGNIVLWVVASVAALCTAFYMFRLYYLTFEGEYRGDPHVLEHAHEEKVMNVPLIVLAGLATIGGFIGIPDGLGFGVVPNVIEHWLEPTVAGGMRFIEQSHSHGLEYALMGASVAIGVGGWLVARRIYNVPADKLPAAPVDSAWHKFLSNKWYFDEVYQAVLVRPLRGLAQFCFKVVDKGLIDGILVHGNTRLAEAAGNGLRRLQNGDVQAYVTAVVLGLAVLVAFIAV